MAQVANVMRRVVWLINEEIKPGEKQHSKCISEESVAQVEGGLRLLYHFVNSCDVYDEDGEKECCPERDVMQAQIVAVGGMDLVFDLIAVGIPPNIREEAGVLVVVARGVVIVIDQCPCHGPSQFDDVAVGICASPLHASPDSSRPLVRQSFQCVSALLHVCCPGPPAGYLHP